MKLAIAGAAGRMGRVLTRIVNETPGAEVAGGIEPKGSPHVGADTRRESAPGITSASARAWGGSRWREG